MRQIEALLKSRTTSWVCEILGVVALEFEGVSLEQIARELTGSSEIDGHVSG